MLNQGLGIVLATTIAAAGCAASRQSAVRGEPRAIAASASADQSAAESLEQYVARVRVLSQRAGVARARSTVTSVEAADPALRDALDRLTFSATPERHRAVAAAYLRAGIADLSFDHLTQALRLDRTDAAAYDALARIWRDWGFPHLGLTDAHRAVYFAPNSAAARNTLGTLLQALGQTGEARRAYEAAVKLDAQAAYALNNLCTLDLGEGRLADAAITCRRALAADPSLLAARRNLTLVLSLQPAGEARTAERGSADGTVRPPRE
jgi:tetratricopeptide (TPR) repeat protein